MYREFGETSLKDLEKFQSTSIQEDRIDKSEFDNLEISKFKTVYYQLVSRGALVTSHLCGEVTHVIMIPKQARYQLIQVFIFNFFPPLSSFFFLKFALGSNSFIEIRTSSLL